MEALDELVDGAPEGPLGVDIQETAHVDQGKQQIPQFLLPGVMGGRAHGLAELLPLLFHLVQGPLHRRPVEAQAGGRFSQPLGLDQGRQSSGDLLQGLFLLPLPLLGLGPLPDAAQVFPGLGLFPGKDVGMAVNHLGGDAFGHLFKGEIPPLLIEIADEHQMQQQVAGFLPDLFRVSAF